MPLRRGLRTLVVDLDPQGNATISLEPSPTAATLAEALDDLKRSTLQRAVAHSSWGESLHVLVGSDDTERHIHPDPTGRDLSRLARLLAQLPHPSPATPVGPHGGPYRLVLLDCPPSLGQLTRSALAAAQQAILVTEPTIFAVAGVQRAFEACKPSSSATTPV